MHKLPHWLHTYRKSNDWQEYTILIPTHYKLHQLITRSKRCLDSTYVYSPSSGRTACTHHSASGVLQCSDLQTDSFMLWLGLIMRLSSAVSESSLASLHDFTPSMCAGGEDVPAEVIGEARPCGSLRVAMCIWRHSRVPCSRFTWIMWNSNSMINTQY